MFLLTGRILSQGLYRQFWLVETADKWLRTFNREAATRLPRQKADWWSSKFPFEEITVEAE